MSKKIIVTTTINGPTEALIKYSQLQDWKLIIVGDLKTPADFSNLDCIYLSPNAQESYSKELSDLIGWNCIQRRNIGFLAALEAGADIIATVDDDNIPLDGWGSDLYVGREVQAECYLPNNFGVFDPISVTEYSNLWHRGFPIQYLADRTKISAGTEMITADIQAGFWNGDPDVDAICRMEHKPECKFRNDNFPFFSHGISPFNSQNTFLTRSALKNYFMFPGIGRMDDIWASYYLLSLGFKVIYSEASVYQSRNPHDLTIDFEGEVIGYVNNYKLLFDLQNNPKKIKDYLPENSWNAFQLYLEIANRYV